MILYKDIAYSLIALEYPERWPELPKNVFERMASASNLLEITATLVIAEQLFKVHEFFTLPKRVLMDNLQIIGMPII